MSEQNVHNVGAVILAAGKGTRLKSVDMPKVMLPIGGKPIVSYIVETLKSVGFTREQICLVVGFAKEKVMEYFGDSVTYAVQEEQLGTAHAAYAGIKALSEGIEDVLVLGGDDSAFYTKENIVKLIQEHKDKKAVLTLLTARLKNPDQLGRVVRHADGGVEIIEKEYLTDEQKKITEISTGTFVFNRAWYQQMFPTMPKLSKLDEYGLPTALAMARESDARYQVVTLEDSSEWFGVNTPKELVEADRRKTLNPKP